MPACAHMCWPSPLMIVSRGVVCTILLNLVFEIALFTSVGADILKEISGNSLFKGSMRLCIKHMCESESMYTTSLLQNLKFQQETRALLEKFCGQQAFDDFVFHPKDLEWAGSIFSFRSFAAKSGYKYPGVAPYGVGEGRLVAPAPSCTSGSQLRSVLEPP